MKRKSLIAARGCLRTRLEKARAQRLLREEVKRLRAGGHLLKLIIGAGHTSREGWLATDLPTLDALKSADWRRVFPPGSVDRILAEHVVEHWSEGQFSLFLRVIRPFLSDQGLVRIAVPDGLHPDPSYIEYVRPGGVGAGADDHRVLYDYVTIGDVLSEERYNHELLEYFDEAGRFHHLAWDIRDGFVQRSADHDRRNRQRRLSYTSLIVDAWPIGGNYGS